MHYGTIFRISSCTWLNAGSAASNQCQDVTISGSRTEAVVFSTYFILGVQKLPFRNKTNVSWGAWVSHGLWLLVFSKWYLWIMSAAGQCFCACSLCRGAPHLGCEELAILASVCGESSEHRGGRCKQFVRQLLMTDGEYSRLYHS